MLYPPASEGLFMSSWHLCRVSQQCQLAWQSKAAHLVRPRRERRDQNTIHSSKKCSSDLFSPVRTLLLNRCKLINLLILWWNWTHYYESFLWPYFWALLYLGPLCLWEDISYSDPNSGPQRFRFGSLSTRCDSNNFDNLCIE